ncbi:hypothetical protein F441_13425 [Phytophthora nicotianae CJ01A1]|uniref:Uncharacterized protein n=6 Tax=Phytophthora nicotianae TaxID=4792 RepID=W2QB06_PHYN3|nr:hypothetical protein PPTG_22727 [Phytophthora nicotianae INRA-310]ETI48481.1 hypothetical protein F443_07485 [Phytophthora nicotianae P1569]ETK88414.1 hypothetical protein L915_07317 [Phytophthora nicotianae]ETO69932.1 hypothetical protein F444_13554 [Phytophthora nicotianae P1976]ETP11037.1 hypothetical protein F441_13425 [Phytophthora nicotianae CJ01A1]ETP39168.1 hypothetical protein F442_13357 [Phytophthora nicotianae P10297]
MGHVTDPAVRSSTIIRIAAGCNGRQAQLKEA